MSHRRGLAVLVKCFRSANYSTSGRLLSTDTSGKSESEMDEKAFSVKRDRPEPLPTIYGQTGMTKMDKTVQVEGALDDCSQISGVPDEHTVGRRARVYVPARTATQAGNDNTIVWKVDLDNRERWENPLMGWSSTGDPISNVSMAMDFASKDDAIRFCLRQGWEYEVEEPHTMKIKPKAYGSNFSWSKSTRVTTK